MSGITRRKTFTTAAVAALLGLAATQLGAGETSDKLTIGAPAPQFTLPDQDGKPVSLGDYAGKVVVLEWTNPGCPFVRRHYEAKTMTTPGRRVQGQGRRLARREQHARRDPTPPTRRGPRSSSSRTRS